MCMAIKGKRKGKIQDNRGTASLTVQHRVRKHRARWQAVRAQGRWLQVLLASQRCSVFCLGCAVWASVCPWQCTRAGRRALSRACLENCKWTKTKKVQVEKDYGNYLGLIFLSCPLHWETLRSCTLQFKQIYVRKKWTWWLESIVPEFRKGRRRMVGSMSA